MVTIRLLQEQDVAEWMRLRFALWPDYTRAAMLAEMAVLRADPAHQPVFVAEDPAGGLCGLMEVSIHPSAPGCMAHRIGYLEAWYVDPAWRQQGIGRQLVAVAEAWARAQGCCEMASDTDAGYPLSPRAHTHLGYETVVRRANGDIHFRKDVLHPSADASKQRG